MKLIEKRWFVGLVAALSLGGVVGMSAARSLVTAPQEMPLPALDSLIARLASEARTGQTR